jgi:hypothetical protein
MRRKPKSKQSRVKTKLGLPDLEHAKVAVIVSLRSFESQRSYRHSIDEFVAWYCSAPRLSFNKTVVIRYRLHLEDRHLAAGTNKEINELPLQGRDWQNLVMLLPGVDRTPGGGFHSIVSNGARPEDNNYIVDGTDDNDLYYGTSVLNEEGVSGTPASLLPIDAIQEFSTQEHPTAEYGWKPGAVVNIGLKSGTNQFHGSAYYFARNSAADARNYFDTVGNPASPLILHQALE